MYIHITITIDYTKTMNIIQYLLMLMESLEIHIKQLLTTLLQHNTIPNSFIIPISL